MTTDKILDKDCVWRRKVYGGPSRPIDLGESAARRPAQQTTLNYSYRCTTSAAALPGIPAPGSKQPEPSNTRNQPKPIKKIKSAKPAKKSQKPDHLPTKK